MACHDEIDLLGKPIDHCCHIYSVDNRCQTLVLRISLLVLCASYFFVTKHFHHVVGSVNEVRYLDACEVGCVARALDRECGMGLSDMGLSDRDGGSRKSKSIQILVPLVQWIHPRNFQAIKFFQGDGLSKLSLRYYELFPYLIDTMLLNLTLTNRSNTSLNYNVF